MTRFYPISKILCLGLGLGCFVSSKAISAQSLVKGQVGLRWNGLSRSNSLRPDYQDLRSYLRLSTEELGRYGLQFYLDARGKKGLDEHLQNLDNPFENRAQIQQAHIKINATNQMRLFLGRHQTPLRGIGTNTIDGLSIERATKEWSIKASGGFQVAFWQANSPPNTATHQWGGELEWHPTEVPVRLQTALLSDRDTQGRNRLRIGLNGTWKLAKALSPSFHIALDPQERKIWTGRLQTTYRLKKNSLLASYTQHLTTPYPVFARGQTRLYGGKVHSLNLAATTRWQRTLSTRLNLRLSYGVRELRNGRLQLTWHKLPLVPFRLTLYAQDSWSPWRRLEQGSLSISGTWPKRLHFDLGIKQSYFKWNTSRQPQWRGRTRPHISLRYSGRLGWSARVKLEEIIDEFDHIRTKATFGLSYRL